MMNHLIQVRVNRIFAAKNDEETEFEKYHEVVLLVDKPAYKRLNEGSIVRERGIDELRFVIAEKNMDAFIEQLQILRSAKKSELE